LTFYKEKIKNRFINLSKKINYLHSDQEVERKDRDMRYFAFFFEEFRNKRNNLESKKKYQIENFI